MLRPVANLIATLSRASFTKQCYNHCRAARCAEHADPAVAAQIEVLYETTHIYERTRIPSPHSGTMNAQDTDFEALPNAALTPAVDANPVSIVTATDPPNATTAPAADRVVERIQYTNLAVAVFEEWLTRGNYDNYHDDATTHSNDEEELQWKIP
jgi:hypothetical protein